MRGITFVIGLWLSICAAKADWPFPAAEGTTWQYSLIRGQDESLLTRRIVSEPSPDGSVNLLRIDTIIDGEPGGSELLRNEGGRILIGHPAEEGQSTPQEQFALPEKLEAGASWNFHGKIAAVPVDLPLRVLEQEKVEVPAGKFQAWHIRGENHGAFATLVDEWFVPNVGSVKETVTQRSPSGELVTRNTLELEQLPQISRAISPDEEESKPIEASISTSTSGEPMDRISTGALQIVARWRVHGVRPGSKVRAAWIAEEVGNIAPEEYKVDEATAVVHTPDAVGTFTLSRPAEGWAAGKYRVDFFVGDAVAESLKIVLED